MITMSNIIPKKISIFKEMKRYVQSCKMTTLQNEYRTRPEITQPYLLAVLV